MATNPSLILALISPCLIAYLGCEDERLLLVVKPVEARPVLSSSVIALPHALCRIVRLPKPAQNIHIGDLRGVENYLHGLFKSRCWIVSDCARHMPMHFARGLTANVDESAKRTSVCPVWPLHTSSYVGLGVYPAE
jgi:hypothetical protein